MVLEKKKSLLDSIFKNSKDVLKREEIFKVPGLILKEETIANIKYHISVLVCLSCVTEETTVLKLHKRN